MAGWISSRLRHRALRDPKMTLTHLLDHGRALKTSESQVSGIEKKVPTAEVNRLSIKGNRTQNAGAKNQVTKHCFYCGGSYPHQGGQYSCPARGSECAKCGKANHYTQYCKSRAGDATQKDTSASSSDNKPTPRRSCRWRWKQQVN